MDCKMDAKYCHYRKNFIEFHRSKFIELSSLVLEKIYGLVKTHKWNKPVRVITSERGAVVENLSIIAGKYLFPGDFIIESRI